MIDAGTAAVIGVVACLVIVYDVWAVWRKGGDGTVSWAVLTWWLLHPVGMFSAFLLIGHLFFPRCGDAGVVSPLTGTKIGVVAMVFILGSTLGSWSRDEVLGVTRAYLWRLVALAVTGVILGHVLFGQYVPCAP